jgi:uncharacterized phage infection (PIP) family protein YhgE
MPAEDGSTWAWVVNMLRDYDATATSHIKAGVSQLRASQASLAGGIEAASAGLHEQATSMEQHRVDGFQGIREKMADAVSSYPESVVGGSAVLLSAATRFTPRRLVFFTLVSGFALRKPIFAKYGDGVEAASRATSEALKTQAHDLGFLPKS